MSKIALLGLGLMGRGIAANLLKAGHDLTVWNRSPERMKPLLDAGARGAASPAEAAHDADVVISIVADDEASRRVWLGADGVLAARRAPGAVAVESTTVSHAWMLELGARCAQAGWPLLDAPVTGGPEGARDARLTVLAGGPASTLERATPVLLGFASRVLHFGPLGAGTAYKLIVNTIGATQIAAVAQGMLLARKLGLPLDVVVDALSSGSAASPVVRAVSRKMAEESFEAVRFAARWRSKDANYGLQLARACGEAAEAWSGAQQLFARTVESGWGDLDESAVVLAAADSPLP